MVPACRSISRTTSRTAGSSSVRLAIGLDAIDLVLAGAEDLGQPAKLATRLIGHVQADQLVPVVVARRQRLGLDLQVAPGQRLRLLPPFHAFQTHDGHATAELHLVDSARRLLALDEQRGADGQPIVTVGEDLQSHGACQPLWTDDAGGRQPVTRR